MRKPFVAAIPFIAIACPFLADFVAEVGNFGREASVAACIKFA